jgi:hypothetical protein
VPNATLTKALAMSLLSTLAAGCTALQPEFESRVQSVLRAQPTTAVPLLEAADLAHLPPPVRRFVLASGAVGRPRVRSFRAEFDAEMFRKPGDAPMVSTSVQYNLVDSPTRLFFMKSRMFGLPVQVFHDYAAERATFRVRVASLVNVVDEGGVPFSRVETVTVLNDLCFFAPGALVDRRLSWEPFDDRTARVTFSNGPHRVSATLHFNERDELVDFTSDDRPQLVDGTYRPYRWSTPIEGYQLLDGRRLPTRGSAVYAYPEGPFTYGKFRLRSVAYDVEAPPAS